MEIGTTEAQRTRDGRRRNPRGQGGRLRHELIDAAGDLLAESGDMRQLTLRGVARRVGIAAPSVYLHFHDVEQLTLAVMARRFPELGAAIATARRDIADPLEALQAGCRAYCNFALEHPGHYRVMFDTQLVTGIHSDAGRHVFEGLVQSIRPCLDADGDGDRDDASRLAGLVWPALHGLVSLRINQPGFPWEPLDKAVDEMVRRLVGAARTASSTTP